MKHFLFFSYIVLPLALVRANEIPTGFHVTPHLEFRGVVYRFNQHELESTLNHLTDRMTELLKADQDKPAQQELRVLRVHLAFAVLSAKCFAAKTPSLMDTLKRIETNLTNQPLPDWFLGPDAMLQGMAAMSFVDKDGQVPDVSTFDLGMGRFVMLAAAAARDIEARSLKKTGDR